MKRDHEIRIIAAHLERLRGRTEIIGVLSRMSPEARRSLRTAIFNEMADSVVPLEQTPLELEPWRQGP